jgi:hypothetical protein
MFSWQMNNISINNKSQWHYMKKKKRPPSPYPDLVPISFVIKERLFCHFTESFKTREEEEAGRRAAVGVICVPPTASRHLRPANCVPANCVPSQLRPSQLRPANCVPAEKWPTASHEFKID